MSLLSALKGKPKPDELPLLPLRELVLFPHTMVPVFISQKVGIAAVEEALKRDRRVFAACRKAGDTENETYEAGCVARLVQQLKLPDGTIRLILEGEYRARAGDRSENDGTVFVRAAPIGVGVNEGDDTENRPLARAVQKSFIQYAELSKR
jgi:ATP-dependent Lon protease